MNQESTDSIHSDCVCRWCTGAIPSRPCMPLYSDVIRVMLTFLTADELHRAVQLSTQFYQVARNTKSIGLVTHSSRLFLILPHSTVARHIAEAKEIVFVCDKFPAFIGLLAERLPNLTRVQGARHVNQKVLQIRETPFQLPLQLQFLDISFDFDCAKPVGMAMSRLSLLQTLKLTIKDKGKNNVRKVDFSTFIPHQLPLLENLALHFHMFSVRDQFDIETPFFSASLVEFVRQSSLVNLRINDLDTDALSHLLDQISSDVKPCPLLQARKLTSIDTYSSQHRYHDAVLLRSLVKFPSLQTVSQLSLTAEPGDAQLLTHLPNLTNLELWSQPTNRGTPEGVIAACKYAPRITRLSIEQERFTEDHLREALSYLLKLTTFELIGCDGVRSLAPLKEFGLPDRLTSLEVWSGNLPDSTITEVIFCLRKLQHLSLQCVFTDSVSTELKMRLQLNTPSCVLPDLLNVSISPK